MNGSRQHEPHLIRAIQQHHRPIPHARMKSRTEPNHHLKRGRCARPGQRQRLLQGARRPLIRHRNTREHVLIARRRTGRAGRPARTHNPERDPLAILREPHRRRRQRRRQRNLIRITPNRPTPTRSNQRVIDRLPAPIPRDNSPDPKRPRDIRPIRAQIRIREPVPKRRDLLTQRRRRPRRRTNARARTRCGQRTRTSKARQGLGATRRPMPRRATAPTPGNTPTAGAATMITRPQRPRTLLKRLIATKDVSSAHPTDQPPAGREAAPDAPRGHAGEPPAPPPSQMTQRQSDDANALSHAQPERRVRTTGAGRLTTGATDTPARPRSPDAAVATATTPNATTTTPPRPPTNHLLHPRPTPHKHPKRRTRRIPTSLDPLPQIAAQQVVHHLRGAAYCPFGQTSTYPHPPSPVPESNRTKTASGRSKPSSATGHTRSADRNTIRRYTCHRVTDDRGRERKAPLRAGTAID